MVWRQGLEGGFGGRVVERMFEERVWREGLEVEEGLLCNLPGEGALDSPLVAVLALVGFHDWTGFTRCKL